MKSETWVHLELADNFIVWQGERPMDRYVATSEPKTDRATARKLADAISAILFVD